MGGTAKGALPKFFAKENYAKLPIRGKVTEVQMGARVIMSAKIKGELNGRCHDDSIVEVGSQGQWPQ